MNSNSRQLAFITILCGLMAGTSVATANTTASTSVFTNGTVQGALNGADSDQNNISTDGPGVSQAGVSGSNGGTVWYEGGPYPAHDSQSSQVSTSAFAAEGRLRTNVTAMADSASRVHNVIMAQGYALRGSNLTSLISLTIPVTFGLQTSLSCTLDIWADAWAVTGADGIGTNAVAISAYGSILRWGVITGVFGSSDTPVTGFSVTSGSGFDYLSAAAVPAPPAVWLLASGLAALGWRSRRKTGPHWSARYTPGGLNNQ
jgi:hypothetical protein